MDKPTDTYYGFGPFRIDPLKRMLFRDGEPVALAPKAFDLLLALVENRGRVLVKDELMQKVWPDQIVEDANITVNMSALRKALGENPHQHLYIVTIPGRGYRFVSDVSESHNGDDLLNASGVAVEGNPQTQPAGGGAVKWEKTPGKQAVSLRGKRIGFGVLVGVLAAALFGINRLTGTDRESTTSNTPRSLAVLPFKQLQASSGDDYLELGIADALITRLSNLSQVTVRPTAQVLKYTYSGEELAAVGRELGVDLVLSGRVQRDGDRIRVTVQMIHAKDGHPVWAQQFDERFTDLFTVEDSISQQVTQALTLKLTADEQQRLAKHSTENSAAYVNYLKGRFYMLRYTPDGFNNSVLHFNQAIALDPNYALAYAGLADTYTATYGGVLSPRDSLQKAKEAAS
ncbi:MAG TPA: winged helix-turn-helix domain-containing protein, partial [Blastocatellia bacterium]|nr:winged helix-turn-helix domain-containing protein [Blastocatellia bacterium]